MKTKEEFEQEERRSRLWTGLDADWVMDEEYMKEKGNVAFKRSCAFFDLVLWEVEPKNWCLEFIPMSSSAYRYNFKTATVNHDEAQGKAMGEVYEVIRAGLKTFGIYPNLDHPVDEIRIQQAFIETSFNPNNPNQTENTLYGVTDNGLLYTYDKTFERWEPVKMRKKL